MASEVFSTSDACKWIKEKYVVEIFPWQIYAVIRRRLLPAPQRVGNYRIFTMADLPRILEAVRLGGYLSEEVPA